MALQVARMVQLIVDIFENDDPAPVVTHIFYGKTQKEAEGVARAHEQTDSFYRAAIRTGSFRGMRLSYTVRMA